MWHDTKLTRALGLRYPIVQGPFGGGLSSVALAAAVSEGGGLGSFGAQPFPPEEILAFNHALRAATSRPYALNLWVSDRDERLASFGEAEYERLKELFRPCFAEFGVPLPARPHDLGPAFEEQAAALLEARPPVFSFVYGIPGADTLEECRRRGIRTVGTATTVAEAIALEDAGVDAVVATGFEAGGHRVSFLQSAESSLTGTFALVPQVADRLSIPVVAAGGIADGRGVAAALLLGADGVQVGTAFLACAQSNATPQHKAALFGEGAGQTVLTKVFTGRLARGLRSRLAEELAPHADQLAPYPLQSLFLRPLRARLLAEGRPDLVTFWAGQAASLLKHHDATALLAALVAETEALLAHGPRGDQAAAGH